MGAVMLAVSLLWFSPQMFQRLVIHVINQLRPVHAHQYLHPLTERLVTMVTSSTQNKINVFLYEMQYKLYWVATTDLVGMEFLVNYFTLLL